ncbi:MAG: hypothetical protein HZA77_10570 [Candidatus Schekmanbacteria bacterium]|nr:hypothetical protein [Candidatus Schekmanbacteria bacterium]
MKKNIQILFIMVIVILGAAGMPAFAGDSSESRAGGVFSETMKNYDYDIQVITACDGRKRVVVEGFKEGELLPPEKAREAAKLLNSLMNYCEAEIVAVIPKNRIDILLSVNGEPFVNIDNTDLQLPLMLIHGGQSHTEREMQIWKAEEQKVIEKGYKLFHSQLTGTNGVSCDMCHPDAVNTHPETYPKFQTQLKKVALLRDMINWCIEKPMEGKPIPDDSEDMKAIEAYILSTRKGVSLDYGKH